MIQFVRKYRFLSTKCEENPLPKWDIFSPHLHFFSIKMMVFYPSHLHFFTIKMMVFYPPPSSFFTIKMMVFIPPGGTHASAPAVLSMQPAILEPRELCRQATTRRRMTDRAFQPIDGASCVFPSRSASRRGTSAHWRMHWPA